MCKGNGALGNGDWWMRRCPLSLHVLSKDKYLVKYPVNLHAIDCDVMHVA